MKKPMRDLVIQEKFLYEEKYKKFGMKKPIRFGMKKHFRDLAEYEETYE